MGCHSLLKGIFLTQGLNLGLPHCRQILYHLSHQGRPSSGGLSKNKKCFLDPSCSQTNCRITYITWRRKWQPTPVLLPGKSHGRRSLVGYNPWGCEEWDTTEQLHFHTLEKEMATHSSVLAWRIPGMGEPGGLPSIGSHRVGHN